MVNFAYQSTSYSAHAIKVFSFLPIIQIQQRWAKENFSVNFKNGDRKSGSNAAKYFSLVAICATAIERGLLCLLVLCLTLSNTTSSYLSPVPPCWSEILGLAVLGC